MIIPERGSAARKGAGAAGVLALLLAMLTTLAPPAVAEAAPRDDPKKPYALIFGTVWSPDHRGVPGVRVKVRRADKKKAQWELVSDARGEFAQRVPAGAAEYVVWAEPKGKHQQRVEVKVRIENDERADIGLHLTE